MAINDKWMWICAMKSLRSFDGLLLIFALLLLTFPLQAVAVSDVSNVRIMQVELDEKGAEAYIVLSAQTVDSISVVPDSSDEFQIAINDRVLPLKNDGLTTDEGIGYIFVIDRTKSYSKNIEFKTAKDIVAKIIDGMAARDRAAFVVVDSEATTNSTFFDKVSAQSFVSALQEKNTRNSALYDGILKASELAHVSMRNIPRRRVIVVVSDCVDGGDGSVGTELLSRQINQSGGCPVITLALYRSTYTGSSKTSSEEARTAMLTLSTTLGGYGKLIDTVSKELDNDILVAAKGVNDYASGLFSVLVNISQAALFEPSSEGYSLSFTYQSDMGSISDQMEIQLNVADIVPSEDVEKMATPIKFEAGITSAEVRYLQLRLQEMYYYTGELHGRFDAETQSAVDLMCMDNMLNVVDGMSVQAWDMLQGNMIQPRATATPVPEPTRDPSMRLMPGDTGVEVRELQYRLQQLYYYDSAITGIYDIDTQTALDAFCLANHMEYDDGLTYEMWELMQSSIVIAKPTATPEPTAEPTATPVPEHIPIAFGDENEFVSKYQTRLKELGYYNDESFTLGAYDSATQRAQDLFCEKNAMAKEQGASIQMQAFVLSSTALENKLGFMDEMRLNLAKVTDIGGMKIPLWGLLVIGIVLVFGVILVIIAISKPKGKKKQKPQYDIVMPTAVPVPNENLVTGSDQPTTAEGLELLLGADAPTSYGASARSISIMIEYQENKTTKEYMVGGSLSIGRQGTVELSGTDGGVSRQHCELYFAGDTLMIKDHSKQGTSLNGELFANEERPVQSGDQLTISNHILTIVY